MNNEIKKQVHISQIKAGDTIELNGVLHTVNKGDIKYSQFMGHSLRGDSSKRYITKVNFIVPTLLGIQIR